MDKKNQQKKDPVKRQGHVDKKDMGTELSPMSPPDPDAKSVSIEVNYEDMDPYFQDLMDEHKELKENLKIFKETIDELKKDPSLFPKKISYLRSFYSFFEQEFVQHNRKEEKVFFPIMHERLIESGEHSSGPEPFTGIDILMDEHVQGLKIYSGLACLTEQISKIPDAKSREIIGGEIIRLGTELFNLMELHIDREDNIIFGLAMKLLSQEDLKKITSSTEDANT